jgi:hypothetical protein
LPESWVAPVQVVNNHIDLLKVPMAVEDVNKLVSYTKVEDTSDSLQKLMTVCNLISNLEKDNKVNFKNYLLKTKSTINYFVRGRNKSIAMQIISKIDDSFVR